MPAKVDLWNYYPLSLGKLTHFSKELFYPSRNNNRDIYKIIYLKIIVKFSFGCNFNCLFFPRKYVPKTFFTFTYFIRMYVRIHYTYRHPLTIKFSSKQRGHKFTPLKISMWIVWIDDNRAVSYKVQLCLQLNNMSKLLAKVTTCKKPCSHKNRGIKDVVGWYIRK